MTLQYKPSKGKCTLPVVLLAKYCVICYKIYFIAHLACLEPPPLPPLPPDIHGDFVVMESSPRTKSGMEVIVNKAQKWSINLRKKKDRPERFKGTCSMHSLDICE